MKSLFVKPLLMGAPSQKTHLSEKRWHAAGAQCLPHP
ncbi:hypothetical protein B597_022240 [Stutzerimonas stutzeri KOS6]|uniref:Uncharacterized protein n=1 Tax=Stutzerimonas stutzeri KOS6 TaxID=1218352 RepID=A0A061JLJ2_STUST|nr:hypothetical protein B597_022240 [Stutzerimonas stutzeri KOS6]